MERYITALIVSVLMVLLATNGTYATGRSSRSALSPASNFEQVRALADSLPRTHLLPLKSEVGKHIGRNIVGSNRLLPATSLLPNKVCSGSSCVADGEWDGTTYGGETETTVDTPGINNSSGYYLKMLYLLQTVGSQYLQIGEIVAKGSPYVACHTDGDGLDDHYFVAGFSDTYHVYSCVPIPANDSNKHTFYEAYFTSGCNFDGGSPDEMNVVVDSASGIQINGCVDTETPSYTEEQLYAADNDTFTNHHVWGGDWLSSSYAHVDGSFHEQTRTFDRSSADDPVQMYWNVEPSVGNPGGQLYSCSYPSGSSCIPGR